MLRKDLFPEPELPGDEHCRETGFTLAKQWQLGRSEFLEHYKVSNEIEFKLGKMSDKQLMQHAQIGYRSLDKSCHAYAEIFEHCAKHNVTVHRYGLCLDWSMGYLREDRKDRLKGTGMILNEVDDFVRLANSAPVAAHFGDFVIGFPASIENTIAALAAGSTSIGNLGQYFAFRLPDYHDDIEVTRATLVALYLISAQQTQVLIHSNLDDGYAGVFSDLTSVLGFALLERYIVSDLIGASISHCFGHHFSEPVTRLAFQQAMAREFNAVPGTLIYGATVLYQGTDVQNYASLGSYLNIDIIGQQLTPTGHAINPVPVSENRRIPEIEEITNAQLYLGRLIECNQSLETIIDMARVEQLRDEIISGAHCFKTNVLQGFEKSGIDIGNPFEMLLGLRRMGARQLETEFGAGQVESPGATYRPLIKTSRVKEISHLAIENLSKLSQTKMDAFRRLQLSGIIVSTDVHEHGKLFLQQFF